jgi:acetyl esterase/lipase
VTNESSLSALTLCLLAAGGLLPLTCLSRPDLPAGQAGSLDSAHGDTAPCPMSAAAMPPVPAGGRPLKIPVATSVAPADTSTSRVIRPDPAAQITCGRVRLQSFRDIVFAEPVLPSGKQARLRMDILVPMPKGKRRPLVVYIPGGGFVMSAKESALNLRTYVAEAGFVVASIEYRTLPEGGNYRDGVSDVKSAIRYLRANASRYGIDPREVAVWGESAGGYLAVMVGVTNGNPSFEAGPDLAQSSAVQAVVDKFGASDISRIASDFDAKTQAVYAHPNPVTAYVGGDVTTKANPLSYIKAGDPPFLIFHGTADRLISPSQTLILHDALRAAGVQSTRYLLEGAGHGDLSFMGDFESGLPWSSRQTMDIIVDFLRQTLLSETSSTG